MIKNRLKLQPVHSGPVDVRHYHRGFTLIELMIVLLVAAILLGVGIPSFERLIKGDKITIATNELLSALNFARTEAVRRGKDVYLTPGAGDVGWVVFDDLNNDNSWTTGEEIRLWKAVPNDVSIATSFSSFTFDDSGFVNNPDVFTICDNRVGEKGNRITLLTSGSVSRNSIDCT